MTQKADQTLTDDVPPAWRKTEPLWPFGLFQTLFYAVFAYFYVRWVLAGFEWFSELVSSVLGISSPFWQPVIGIGVAIIIACGLGFLPSLGRRCLKQVMK